MGPTRAVGGAEDTPECRPRSPRDAPAGNSRPAARLCRRPGAPPRSGREQSSTHSQTLPAVSCGQDLLAAKLPAGAACFPSHWLAHRHDSPSGLPACRCSTRSGQGKWVVVLPARHIPIPPPREGEFLTGTRLSHSTYPLASSQETLITGRRPRPQPSSQICSRRSRHRHTDIPVVERYLVLPIARPAR